jgi:hypothetical protein
MAVIVVVQEDSSVRREVEQALDRLQIFNLGVVKLIAQLPILQDASAADIDTQHCTEDA